MLNMPINTQQTFNLTVRKFICALYAEFSVTEPKSSVSIGLKRIIQTGSVQGTK
jgi:hypothetical protein